MNRVHRLLCGSLLGVCFLQPVAFVMAEPSPVYEAQVSVSEQLRRKYPQVNSNDIVQVPSHQKLDIRIASLIGDGVSQVGDEFYGKLSSDYCVNDKLLLPRGTIIHGSLAQITDPKKAGRKGHMQLAFDYLITPDGREIDIKGQSSTKDAPVVAGAKVVTRALGYTALGGVVGAVTVLKLGGLVLNAASQGYALAAGAALGGAGGLSMALLSKGEAALLQPGAEVSIQLEESLRLPSMQRASAEAETLRYPGLEVAVLNSSLGNNAFEERSELTLQLDLSNQSESAFSLFDFALMDEHHQLFYPSPLGDRTLLFGRLKPHTNMRGNLSFDIEDPTAKHYLVVLKGYNRSVVAKFPIGEPDTAGKKRKRTS